VDYLDDLHVIVRDERCVIVMPSAQGEILSEIVDEMLSHIGGDDV
jgi:hypothetical protein